MKKTKLKSKNGITLIALVITIIVLLILAGVGIATLTGDNGILGKASKAKIENEKAEIQDMLALSVNTIAIERGQKQDDLKVYYTDRETFVEKGQFDTKSYPINEYNLDAENNIVSITIYKDNGTGNQYEYEIDLTNGSIKFKNQKEIVGPECIEESNPEYFEYSYNEDIATIIGLSTEGINAYNEGKEDIINLVIPKKCENNGIEYNIKAIVGEGKETFEQRTKIEKLIIHDNVTALGNNVFAGCTGITELTIPISLNPINSIDNSNYPAFKNCNGITKVTFTKGTSDGHEYRTATYTKTPWYYSREKSIKVSFEEGITKIGAYMFEDCTGLQMVEMPTTLKEIGEYAFKGCTGMQGEINTIEGLTALGSAAFDGCTGLTGTIVIPNGITEIKENTFRNTKIEKLIIHDNVIALGSNVFDGCTEITELTIPISLNPINSIDNSNYPAFKNCNGITKVTFTKGTSDGHEYRAATYIKTPWYYSRNNKMNIIINKDITSIGTYTFNGLTNATFYYTGSQEEWLNVTVGTNNTINIQSYNYTE